MSLIFEKAERRDWCTRLLWLFSLFCLMIAIGIAVPTQAQKTETVQFPNEKKMGSGFLAVPDKPGRFSAVIVIHEWWGLDDWIKEQTQKLAAQGFVALAVDLYNGQVATNASQAEQLLYSVPQDEVVGDLMSAYTYLTTRNDVDHDRIAAMGWGSGGGYALQFAIHQPRLAACIVNYGALPTDPNDTELIGAAVLGNFGGEDHGITAADALAFQKTMTSQGKRVDIKIYDGAGHGFENPANATDYNAQDAADAWSRSIKFLNKILR